MERAKKNDVNNSLESNRAVHKENNSKKTLLKMFLILQYMKGQIVM